MGNGLWLDTRSAVHLERRDTRSGLLLDIPFLHLLDQLVVKTSPVKGFIILHACEFSVEGFVVVV
jgi:hypothetical protein